MSHDVDDVATQNAGIVMYRNVKDTVRTHFAETNGAGAFLEAPLQAYYGRKYRLLLIIIMYITIFTPTYYALPPYDGALSDDARLTSVSLPDVCLSRTSGLTREQRGLED